MCQVLGMYGPSDRLLLYKGASASAQVTHTRCLADAWKLYQLLILVACFLAGCLLKEGAR